MSRTHRRHLPNQEHESRKLQRERVDLKTPKQRRAKAKRDLRKEVRDAA